MLNRLGTVVVVARVDVLVVSPPAAVVAAAAAAADTAAGSSCCRCAQGSRLDWSRSSSSLRLGRGGGLLVLPPPPPADGRGTAVGMNWTVEAVEAVPVVLETVPVVFEAVTVDAVVVAADEVDAKQLVPERLVPIRNEATGKIDRSNSGKFVPIFVLHQRHDEAGAPADHRTHTASSSQTRLDQFPGRVESMMSASGT